MGQTCWLAITAVMLGSWSCTAPGAEEEGKNPGVTADAGASPVAADATPQGNRLPTIGFTNPSNDSEVAGVVSLEVSTTAEPSVAQVVFSIDGTELVTTTSAPHTASWDTFALLDGPYQLSAEVTDSLGQSASTEIHAIVRNPGIAGNNKPLVRATYPVAGAVVCGEFSLQAAATDDSNINRVEFYLDGTLLGSDASSPYSFNLNTLVVADGPHEIKVIAVDDADGKTQDHLSVEVLNTGGSCDNAPAAVITSPSEDSAVNNDVLISAIASDDVGVVKVQFFLDGSLIQEKTIAPYQFTWDSDPFSEGAHTLKVLAYDTGGNTSVQEIQVAIDRTAPTLSITTPTEDSLHTSDFTVQVSVSDNTGIKRVTFEDNGNVVANWTSAPFDQYAWVLGDHSCGSHDLEVVVEDKAGFTKYAWVSFLSKPACDLDCDGYTAMGVCGGDDCNDDNASINVGASDNVGNSIDSNCDGSDGVDGDGDGHATLASGGDDCDDGASAVYLGATDSLGDGVDQDCDGYDGTEMLCVSQYFEHSVAAYSLDANGTDLPSHVYENLTQLVASQGIDVDPATGDIYVLSASTNSILVYPATADGTVAPTRVISGANTLLTAPSSLRLAPSRGEIFVSDHRDGVHVFAMSASGDIAPLRTLSGGYAAVMPDETHGEVVVLDGDTVTTYSITAQGAAIPIRSFTNTYAWFSFVEIDPVNNEIYVVEAEESNHVAVYDRLATGASPAALRTLPGYSAVLVDPVNNELYLASNGGVAVYARTTTGYDKPIRVLNTDARDMSLNNVSNELIAFGDLGDASIPAVKTYARTAENNTTALRTISDGDARVSYPDAITHDPVSQELLIYNKGLDTILVRDADVNSSTASSSDVGIRLLAQDVTVDGVNDELVIADQFGPSIWVLPTDADGSQHPLRRISGPNTNLSDGNLSVAVDASNDEIFVADGGQNAILVYSRTAFGDVAPIRTIVGGATLLDEPVDIIVDTTHDELFVLNRASNAVHVYARSASGAAAPLRIISGAATGMDAPAALDWHVGTDRLFVGNSGSGVATVTAYPRTGTGDVTPLQTIEFNTFNNITALVVSLNWVHVTSWGGTNVLSVPIASDGLTTPGTYFAMASGYTTGLAWNFANSKVVASHFDSWAPLTVSYTSPPQQIVQAANPALSDLELGPEGQLLGLCTTGSVVLYELDSAGTYAPVRSRNDDATSLMVDLANEEVFATDKYASTVAVYDLTTIGAPTLRTIVGALTQLVRPVAVAIDETRDEIVVVDDNTDQILVFARSASGNTAPLRVIGGNATGITAPSDIIVTHFGEYAVLNAGRILVFPSTSEGDVTPTRILEDSNGRDLALCR